MMGLQDISSKPWRIHFADFSQAFMQGDLLQRHAPLYCAPPGRELLGLSPNCLIEIRKTVYGYLMPHIDGTNILTPPFEPWVTLLPFLILAAICCTPKTAAVQLSLMASSWLPQMIWQAVAMGAMSSSCSNLDLGISLENGNMTQVGFMGKISNNIRKNLYMLVSITTKMRCYAVQKVSAMTRHAPSNRSSS